MVRHLNIDILGGILWHSNQHTTTINVVNALIKATNVLKMHVAQTVPTMVATWMLENGYAENRNTQKV
jgi:hypothetical protein